MGTIFLVVPFGGLFEFWWVRGSTGRIDHVQHCWAYRSKTVFCLAHKFQKVISALFSFIPHAHGCTFLLFSLLTLQVPIFIKVTLRSSCLMDISLKKGLPWTCCILCGSFDPTTGIFYKAPKHMCIQTMQACNKHRVRKAKVPCPLAYPYCLAPFPLTFLFLFFLVQWRPPHLYWE